MSNTTRQVELWKPGDAITSVRLNEMAEAINFLLKASGYIFNRVALANYHANESSGTNFDYPGIIQEVEMAASNVRPHINAGRLVIPVCEAGEALTGVSYDATASAPYIASNTLFLNYASAASGANYPGAIAGLAQYDPSGPSSPAAPGIFDGVITIPAGVTAALYDSTATEPEIAGGTLHLPLANSEASDGNTYPGAVSSVELYDPSHPSAPAEPGIFNGVITIPAAAASPGGVTDVTYDENATMPNISNGIMFLNMADSLQGTYPGSVVGVQTYDPSHPSAPAGPCIDMGVIKVPFVESSGGGENPGGVTDVAYDENSTTPYITNGTLFLNMADSLQGTYPGSVLGVQTYDPSHPSAPAGPCIEMGVIKVPFVESSGGGGGGETSGGVTSVNYGSTGSTTPAPGVDGWVQTLYMWGYYTGNLDHTYATRQLMRVNGSVLEVVQQISYDDGNSWTESSA